MKLNQKLGWKFLIPVGLLLWFPLGGVLFGLIGILGMLMTIVGIIDLYREKHKKKPQNQSGNQPQNQPPVERVD